MTLLLVKRQGTVKDRCRSWYDWIMVNTERFYEVEVEGMPSNDPIYAWLTVKQAMGADDESVQSVYLDATDGSGMHMIQGIKVGRITVVGEL